MGPRIEKGKYLIVPLEAGPERIWTEDAHVIAGHLVSPAMVSHRSALGYWNLTEQVPRVTYVQTHPPEPRLLDEWLGLLTAGIRKLDPSTPTEAHRMATGWRIKVNLPEEGLLK